MTAKDLVNNVNTQALLTRPLSDWRPILSLECQVYVFGESYLAKRFDQINYKFCEKNEAKEVLIDNLYALLRYKYFPIANEEIDERITKIVASFTANLKTTLRRVSFDKNSDAEIINLLPDYCIAFRNGVYDFKNDKWFFKYDIIKLEKISNTIYNYSNKYVIQWYLDYDFDPLPISICNMKLEDMIDIFKQLTKTNRNYCFELMYNISHDANDRFSEKKFEHLCQILGYLCLQSFSQHFVFLIGSGQNGKNSLFDGCFTNRVVPRPSANDLDSIENDRFITGALENKAHNLFLETSAKIYTESKMIKALTGSMYQTIESKGISRYSGVINCKYLFAGNDQDKIKFSDNTTGFRRRINMFEIFYHWDSSKRYMKRNPDYYDTTFSDSLSELKDDVTNTTAFVYFAMFGILKSTTKFTKNFQFTFNDWSDKYSDIDTDIKDSIENVTVTKLADYLTRNQTNDIKNMIYDEKGKALKDSTIIESYGYKGFDGMIDMLKDDAISTTFFADHDVYISLRELQKLIKDITSPTMFTQTVKKIYKLTKLESWYGNKPYVKCTFIAKKLKILK